MLAPLDEARSTFGVSSADAEAAPPAPAGHPRRRRLAVRTQTGKRAALLLTVVSLALVLVACGRATEADILAAVGITPTATQSAEQIATSTAAAAAQQTAAAGAASSPAVDVAALGDVNRGRNTFNTWCLNCHQPGGSGTGPDLLAPGGPGASITLESLTVLIREAPEHNPPGPYDSTFISDRSIGDLAAYILSESSS
jgi:mono/diheme cytochrome c family protein